MRILLGEHWVDGYPDHHRGEGDYRLRVLALHNLERLEGLYFIRPASLRTLWNYLREVGPVNVARKVLSRRQERDRNEKFVSCGIGQVLESPSGGRFPVGECVAFVLPVGPRCLERIVLPEDLLSAAELPAFSRDRVLHRAELPELSRTERWWQPVRAWTPYSGQYLQPAAAEYALKEAVELIRLADWMAATPLPADKPREERGDDQTNELEATPTRSRTQSATPPRPDARKTAILFGYGNYAKTTVLPHVAPFLRVDRVHEIDPTQMRLGASGIAAWDTSPVAGSTDEADAFLIAGFHHTHAPLACQALRRGAAAVVEKPFATDRAQLKQLTAAMRETGGRVFGCFQRRYHPFNEMALSDLGIEPGGAVNYHCIVYEVPLPELHWYRWPNSHTRLISNGCHWVDHFLCLNDYCDVASYDISAAPDGTTNCSVALANGAYFTMVLTDHGSDRIGVQDHVELRANDATVKLVNATRYESENGQKVLRRKRVNKIEAYRLMYQSIGKSIADGSPGDSLRSVECSTTLVLDLEQRLSEASLPPRRTR
jgi:predicted dehydrogenase